MTQLKLDLGSSTEDKPEPKAIDAGHLRMMEAPLPEYVRYMTRASMKRPQNIARLRMWLDKVGEAQIRERLILIQYPYNPRAVYLSDLDWHVTAPFEEVFAFAL